VLKKILNTLLICFPLICWGSTADNWPSIAKRDLIAIHNIINTQTPGPVDIHDKLYREWMDKGLHQSFQLAETIRSYQSYVYVLKYYVNGFHDEHIIINFNSNIAEHYQKRWAGFITYYNHGIFLVSAYGLHEKENNHLPPVNAKLIQCDGITPKKMASRDIFPYDDNPSLESDWVSMSPWLLIDDGNPWKKIPAQCVFNSEGKIKTIKLIWQPLPEDIHPENTAYSYHPKFNVAYVDKTSIWISIASFNTAKKENLAGLQKLVFTASQWRNSKKIVIDVRGNGGGNSEWGTKILSALYGENYFSWSQNLHPDYSQEQFRVSKDNLNFLKRDLSYCENTSGKESDCYKFTANTIHQMEIALEQKKSLTPLQETNSKHSIKMIQHPNNPVKAKVVVVTDGRCGSSCLTFVGQLINIPGVILVGAPTHADSYYTEIHYAKLPSTFAELGFPMKVMRKRSRLSNQPYIPRYIFPDDINNTKRLKEWIIKKVVRVDS
jgi:hypothetical protein